MKMYTCPMHPEVQSDKPGKCPKCGMTLIEKDEQSHRGTESMQHTSHTPKENTNHGQGVLYTCPMDPDVMQDAPGNCPKCGMKLVPMTSEHEGHEDHASMERDFKRRFFITLPFVILSILLSRMIQMWLGLDLAIPGQELLLFAIGTFVFFNLNSAFNNVVIN